MAAGFHPICQQYITFCAKINGFRAKSMRYTAAKWRIRDFQRPKFAVRLTGGALPAGKAAA
jgi:hypothetical protein